jgi:hypothetical protein
MFIGVSRTVGLDFVHFNGMSGACYLPEMTGQGGAFVDYDNDGDLDVYLVQGAMLGADKTLADALFPPREAQPRDRLFRNDLTVSADGARTLRFVDVTDAAGIRVDDYGMGVATGDFDNDGWMDLYVTNFGPNRMLRNDGDGTFTEVSDETGTADPSRSTSAAFVDYDRDGWLDLYVANYVAYSLERNVLCYARSSRRDYCGPLAFAPSRDRLFHNRRDGTFEDVTGKVLAGYRPGPGLGVVSADFNGDGWVDLYVANDGAPNQLWLNQQGRSFREDALFAGAGVNRDGQPEASMGVDAGEFDGDADEDLFMTHLMGETNTLYVNDRSALFEDRTNDLGLGAASFPYTAFGVAWLDYDNDGWLDLLVMNGTVRVLEPLARTGERYPLDQPNQLFHDRQERVFTDVTALAGPAFSVAKVSRGAAFADPLPLRERARERGKWGGD